MGVVGLSIYSCCGTCDICADTGGDGPCGLAQVAGTVTSDANFIYVTASNSIALSSQTSGSAVEVWAQADFIAGDSGDQPRVILKSDSTGANSWFAQVTCGTGATLKIFERVASVNTQRATLSVTAPELETMTLHFCYGEGNLVATLLRTGNNSAQVSYTVATAETGRPYAGVGVGTITSEVDFSNFQYNYGYNASGQSSCPHCLKQPAGCLDVCGFSPSNTPDFDMVADFSAGTYARGECGVTWGANIGIECNECDDFNGEIVIPAETGFAGAKCPFGTTVPCPSWRYNADSPVEWCSEATDATNEECNTGNLMQLCISVVLKYKPIIAKWHWTVYVYFIDGSAGVGTDAEYDQDDSDPSVYTICDEGPWTLNRTAYADTPAGPPCEGSLPTSIGLRVQ